jgi:glutaredoxin 3
MVKIYGKDECPYTQNALRAYRERGEVSYLNVKKDGKLLEEMLGLSKGQRRVPVIVDGEKVTIGFGGT